MPYYVARGRIPHKRHTQFRKADGGLYHEELLGSEGFAGASTLVYRLNPPTRVQRIFAQPPLEREIWDEPVHRHHLLRTIGAQPHGDAIGEHAPRLDAIGRADRDEFTRDRRVHRAG